MSDPIKLDSDQVVRLGGQFTTKAEGLKAEAEAAVADIQRLSVPATWGGDAGGVAFTEAYKMDQVNTQIEQSKTLIGKIADVGPNVQAAAVRTQIMDERAAAAIDKVGKDL